MWAVLQGEDNKYSFSDWSFYALPHFRPGTPLLSLPPPVVGFSNASYFDAAGEEKKRAGGPKKVGVVVHRLIRTGQPQRSLYLGTMQVGCCSEQLERLVHPGGIRAAIPASKEFVLWHNTLWCQALSTWWRCGLCATELPRPISR